MAMRPYRRRFSPLGMTPEYDVSQALIAQGLDAFFLTDIGKDL
jgi:hypothetical protein